VQVTEPIPVDDTDKLLKVTCYNCAEWGHYSTDCKASKLCFICQTAAHVGQGLSRVEEATRTCSVPGECCAGLRFLSRGSNGRREQGWLSIISR
jgi:hypothetical protein